MNSDFEAMVEQSIAKCTTLSPKEARHFLEHGWVVVKGAVSKQIAADIVACAWRELEERGSMKDDPQTWNQQHEEQVEAGAWSEAVARPIRVAY